MTTDLSYNNIAISLQIALYISDRMKDLKIIQVLKFEQFITSERER